MTEFDGVTYNHKFDYARLNKQAQNVYRLMCDGKWRTLQEISDAVKAPQASVSARLRDLRKPKFGGFLVNRRARGMREKGLFEYQVVT